MTTGYNIKDQLMYEVGIWKKEIEKIQKENAEMKDQMVFLIKNLKGKELLESLEKYQTLFILQDRIIAILRNDVFRQTEMIKNTLQESAQKLKASNLQFQKKIRKEIALCEKEIMIIKEEFEAFVKKTDGHFK